MTPEERKLRAYAHGKVDQAKLQGKLIIEPCEVCGSKYSEAHHDDYTKPLEVRWLCPLHHRRHHVGRGPDDDIFQPLFTYAARRAMVAR